MRWLGSGDAFSMTDTAGSTEGAEPGTSGEIRRGGGLWVIRGRADVLEAVLAEQARRASAPRGERPREGAPQPQPPTARAPFRWPRPTRGHAFLLGVVALVAIAI